MCHCDISESETVIDIFHSVEYIEVSFQMATRMMKESSTEGYLLTVNDLLTLHKWSVSVLNHIVELVPTINQVSSCAAVSPEQVLSVKPCEFEEELSP